METHCVTEILNLYKRVYGEIFSKILYVLCRCIIVVKNRKKIKKYIYIYS